tara:strand:- start:10611 stop:11255 length:645 start_codon:yes stop_codon:yes gene_type:complete
MPDETLTPLQAGTDLNQALRFHARERRRSLAGVPEMSRTHRIFGTTVMEVATINTTSLFPARDTPITFKTAIRITAAVPTGLVFELGDSTTGCAIWIDATGDEIHFHAGAAGTVNGATAVFDNTIDLPDGLELELVAAVRPGDGRIRLWGNGQEIARAEASGGSFTDDWAGVGDGSFAAAVSGTTIAAVTGAPANFEVIEPLSVYVGQVPRHFV